MNTAPTTNQGNPKVTLSPERQMYVIQTEHGFSNHGYTVVMREATALAQKLGVPPPAPELLGTIEAYHAYLALIEAYGQSPHASLTWFSPGTNPQVALLLEQYRHSGRKLRWFYGDPATGRVWLESEDVVGFISRSGGTLKVPIGLRNPRSKSGAALLTSNILKLVDPVSKLELYCNATFQLPKLSVKPGTEGKYPWDAFADNTLVARFPTDTDALNWVAFMEGRIHG